MNTQNDRRIDELSDRTDKGFEEVKGEIKEVRQEMREGFARADKRFDAIDQRFARLTNTLLGGSLGVIAAILGSGIFG